jgi:hypothetical protein
MLGGKENEVWFLLTVGGQCIVWRSVDVLDLAGFLKQAKTSCK